MVKKLQAQLAKAKAKKGFTLVELIVVIAIIAVLAAILIPTLTSQLQKSQVTSADTTARKMADFVNQYITNYVTAGGSYASTATVLEIDANIANNYNGGIFTNTKAIAKVGDFGAAFKEEFNLKAASKAAVFIDTTGKAYAAIYTESEYAITKGEFSKDATTGIITGKMTWKDAKHEGVTATGGHIVGTFPKIEYKASGSGGAGGGAG